MAQQIKRGAELLVDAKVEAAIIGDIGRPKRFPKEWVERLPAQRLTALRPNPEPHLLTHP